MVQIGYARSTRQKSRILLLKYEHIIDVEHASEQALFVRNLSVKKRCRRNLRPLYKELTKLLCAHVFRVFIHAVVARLGLTCVSLADHFIKEIIKLFDREQVHRIARFFVKSIGKRALNTVIPALHLMILKLLGHIRIIEPNICIKITHVDRCAAA